MNLRMADRRYAAHTVRIKARISSTEILTEPRSNLSASMLLSKDRVGLRKTV
jgi:hypothetical protein